jgi:hypothetical protein
MINLLLAIIIGLIIGKQLGLFKFDNYIKTYTQQDFEQGLCSRHEIGDENPNSRLIAKAILTLCITLLIWLLGPIGVQWIKSDTYGLKIDRLGTNKGVPIVRDCQGVVFYNTYLTDVNEYDRKTRHIEFDQFEVACKGGTLIPVKPSLNMAVKKSALPYIYTHLTKSEDLSDIDDKFVKNAVNIAITNATNLFTPDSIFNNADNYRLTVESYLKLSLGKYFDIDQVKTGQRPPKSMIAQLQRKAEAVQNAQQAELDRQTAVARAQEKMATARGDSAEAVITASGRAIAIQKEQSVITPTYVEYIKWTKAASTVERVPSTILGTNTSVLYNSK